MKRIIDVLKDVVKYLTIVCITWISSALSGIFLGGAILLLLWMITCSFFWKTVGILILGLCLVCIAERFDHLFNKFRDKNERI